MPATTSALSGNAADTQGDSTTETVVCEFHVVYHVVYQTPVLYFRAARLDGSPFPVAAHVSALQLPGSRLGAAAVASMEEHPVLGTPFWFLHPCETAAAMELLLQHQHPHHTEKRDLQSPRHKETAYIFAWLSLVAPLTGVDPLRYVRELS